MNIYYVTMTFPAPSETFATNDVRELRRRGLNVSVHSLKPAVSTADTLLKERGLQGIPVSYGNRKSILAGLRLMVSRPRAAIGLILELVRRSVSRPEHLVKAFLLIPRTLHLFEKIRTDRPDVVHVYWGHYPSMVGFLVQEFLPGTVVTISLAAYDLEEEFGLSTVVAQRADAVRTLAHANTRRISEAYGVPVASIEVIPDGVDLDRYGLRDGSRSSTSLKVPKRFTTIGRLTVRKGMYDVIHAFAGVSAICPDASLVVMGDGPEREGLEALCASLGISGAVEFLGHVDHARVFDELSRAELFLFMSRGDGERLPNVVKEAMLCRCVCVVSETTGMRELVPSESVGFVIPIGAVEEATKLSLDCLEHPERMVEIADAARRHILDGYDLRRSIDLYIRLWNGLIPRSTGRRANSDGSF